jgi:hypothetical protein
MDLTREQIENMAAGREMDALVAEHVMGFRAVGYYGPTKPNGMHQDYERFETAAQAMERYVQHWPEYSRPAEVDLCHWKENWGPLFVGEYSTDIAAAWDVVDALQAGLCFELRRRPDGGFWCWFGERMSAEAESAPLAICRAALLSRLS